MTRHRLGLALALLLSATSPTLADDASELRRIHAQIIQAHLDRDAEAWTKLEADTVLVASRGEVFRAGRTERLAMRKQYLGATRFSVYRDLQEPIVRISDDASQGWLIANVEVIAHGATDSLRTVWAWIELYERVDGRWLMVGNVSNHAPEP